MPVPPQYQRATDDLFAFLSEARDQAGLVTTNQAYTMVQGVLQTFRTRLSLPDAIRFVGVLPAVVRALFVADWDPDEPLRPLGDRAAMTAESSETFIDDLAVVPAQQRQGIGRRLVATLRALAAAQGIEVAFVPADNDDVHALDFYRAIGSAAAPVTIFTFGADEH